MNKLDVFARLTSDRCGVNDQPPVIPDREKYVGGEVGLLRCVGSMTDFFCNDRNESSAAIMALDFLAGRNSHVNRPCGH